jgi:hypothetical protein
MKPHSYYPLPRELVAAIRSSDVLTGEFLRIPLSAEAAESLRSLGLVGCDLGRLSELGIEVRSWLMRGMAEAPATVAKLLEQTDYRMAA